LFQLFQRRPFFGVPFSCKDSFSVEGQIVTCGSYYRRNHRCENTALAVQRVREAGGILIAITNVPEWCCWIESDNCVYGRSNNPYDTRRIVGGSSGGEGALISSAGTPIGVGSDIGGSIRIPSFCNGIFGMMPTPGQRCRANFHAPITDCQRTRFWASGIVPLDNYIPVPVGYKKQVLRVGPMCRYVEDMPLLLKVC
uniref:Amidase domain-containing protein n=1 Tax=Heligmosomoides polygyrus TaxID=6339 RepID=A0A8L8JVF4_HELPZ